MSCASKAFESTNTGSCRAHRKQMTRLIQRLSQLHTLANQFPDLAPSTRGIGKTDWGRANELLDCHRAVDPAKICHQTLFLSTWSPCPIFSSSECLWDHHNRLPQFGSSTQRSTNRGSRSPWYWTWIHHDEIKMREESRGSTRAKNHRHWMVRASTM